MVAQRFWVVGFWVNWHLLQNRVRREYSEVWSAPWYEIIYHAISNSRFIYIVA